MSEYIVCPCCGAVVLLKCIPGARAVDEDKHEVETQ